jgi:pyridoxal phosphate enzyme (YggS family)
LDRRETIAANLAGVRTKIAAAATRAGRQPDDVRLVAVSKTFGLDCVHAAFLAGQREFGENKVQEALQKIGESADMAIAWHLIGHLQSNKARRAAGAFATIHSIDSVDLLRRVDLAAAEARSSPELLLQVDFAGEATKHGAPETDVAAIARAAGECQAARLVGLMLLPPWSEDPEQTRPYFRRLRLLRDRLVDQGFDPAQLRELSMGMSHDFEVAIEEGATLVRVGTAIFGKRTVRT